MAAPDRYSLPHRSEGGDVTGRLTAAGRVATF
jgi:hypothetical protein